METTRPENPFTHLPRELRDTIYDHAFGSTPLYFEYGSYAFVLSTSGVPDALYDTVKGLPQWLLTNREICSEAISHLLRTRNLILRYAGKSVRPTSSRKRPQFGDYCCGRLAKNQSAVLSTPAAPTHPPPSADAETEPAEPSIHSCTPIHNPLILQSLSTTPSTITLLFPSSYPLSIRLFHAQKRIGLTHTWTDLLTFIYPFLNPAHIRLHLDYDARSGPKWLKRGLQWPESWNGRVERVRVVLLVNEGLEDLQEEYRKGVEESVEACRRGVEQLVGRLVGSDDAETWGWVKEEVGGQKKGEVKQARFDLTVMREGKGGM